MTRDRSTVVVQNQTSFNENIFGDQLFFHLCMSTCDHGMGLTTELLTNLHTSTFVVSTFAGMSLESCTDATEHLLSSSK